MKAALFYGPKDMRIEDIPKPKCPEGGALLKLEGSLICGTDIKIYNNGHPQVKPPQTIGHETCGYIEDIDDPNYGLKVGDRVTVQTTISCGKCDMCLQGLFNLCENIDAICWSYPGTFAEYVAIPKEAMKLGNLLKAPENLKDEEVCLAEPLACVINGQEKLNIKPGERVLIVGAGPIGILHAELARIQGANVIIAERSEERIEMAKKFGYDYYINTDKENQEERIKEITGGKGVDVAIVTAPAKAAFEDAIKAMALRGRISFFASLPAGRSEITLDSRPIHYKELYVIGASSSKTYHMKKALDILSSGKIQTQHLITGELPLDKLEDGILQLMEGKGLKIYVKN